uniref:uncharacterized protein LOC127062770 isoform X2 n=1 Tax=Vespula vulgaris TaxID=7454 RepID=UPI0021253C4A|nr:uncharacterized protein LOC127062770 isoform X2 [Vespula vulgaris]
MVALKISIFVLSLVLFEVTNGHPIRIADYKENDSNIEMLLSNRENERSHLLLKGRRRRNTRKNLYETRRIHRRTSESMNDEILIR